MWNNCWKLLTCTDWDFLQIFLDVRNLMLGILCWGGGGYSWEFLVGVGHAVSQILTLFPHLFSDQISKIHPCFHTWPLGRNYVIITYGRAQTKKILQIHFEFTYFPFLLWNNKLIHSYTPIVPSKTIPDSRPKWAKFIYTHSQTKKAQKPYPLGWHIPIWRMWGSTPPPLTPYSWYLPSLHTLKDWTQWSQNDAIWFHREQTSHKLCQFTVKFVSPGQQKRKNFPS